MWWWLVLSTAACLWMLLTRAEGGAGEGRGARPAAQHKIKQGRQCGVGLSRPPPRPFLCSRPQLPGGDHTHMLSLPNTLTTRARRRGPPPPPRRPRRSRRPAATAAPARLAASRCGSGGEGGAEQRKRGGRRRARRTARKKRKRKGLCVKPALVRDEKRSTTAHSHLTLPLFSTLSLPPSTL